MLIVFGIDPAIGGPPAWKDQSVDFIAVYDGQLKVLIEARRYDWLPHGHKDSR